jgi:hypothetical protein
MATIGLDKLYYSKITEDSNGQETYTTPLVLAKAITAELSVELVEAILASSYQKSAGREISMFPRLKRRKFS